jgi:hypothetical protein
MRRTVVFLVLAAAGAAPVSAQHNQGAFGLDAFVAPNTGLGFSYYITDGLSLRPFLGLGYSDYSGFYANVGAAMSYEFARRDSRLAPYLTASAQYSHYGNSSYVPATTAGGAYQPYVLDGNIGQFGAGAGLRYRVSDNFALFAEGRAMYATSPMGPYGLGWSSIEVNSQTHVDAILGLTYFMH